MNDVDSYESFVSAYTVKLLTEAGLLTSTADEANELVQNTLERVFRKWRAVSKSESPLAYSRRIMRNIYFDEVRSRTRRPPPLELREELRGLPTERDSSTVALDRMVLRAALAQLSPQQRYIVTARSLYGSTFAELADELEVGESTVRSNYSRALAKLKRGLIST